MKKIMKPNKSRNYIQNIQDEITKQMEDVFGSIEMFDRDKKMWRPPLEISETDGAYEMKLQLPGFEKKDIDIEVGDDYINVKAENTFEKEEKKKNLYRSEFKYGNFLRTVSFPSHISPEKANAELVNGVLVITVEKATGKENVRKLQVKE